MGSLCCVSIKVMVSNFDTCQSLLYTQPLNQRESPQPTRYLLSPIAASLLLGLPNSIACDCGTTCWRVISKDMYLSENPEGS